MMTTNSETKIYAMPDQVYDVLKWLAMLGLPTLSTFVIALGNIWGIELATPVAATITAFGALVGGWLGLSTLTATKGVDDGRA